MLLCLREGSAQTIGRAATLRQKQQIKLSISPSQSQYTDCWSASPSSMMPGAWQGSHCKTNVKSLVSHDLEKAGTESRSAGVEADTLSPGQHLVINRDVVTNHPKHYQNLVADGRLVFNVTSKGKYSVNQPPEALSKPCC